MAAWGPNCWWQGAPSTASRCEFVPHSQEPRSPFPRLHAIKPRISFTHPKSHLLLEHTTGITQLSHFFFSPIKKSHFQKRTCPIFTAPHSFSPPLPQEHSLAPSPRQCTARPCCSRRLRCCSLSAAVLPLAAAPPGNSGRYTGRDVCANTACSSDTSLLLLM